MTLNLPGEGFGIRQRRIELFGTQPVILDSQPSPVSTVRAITPNNLEDFDARAGDAGAAAGRAIRERYAGTRRCFSVSSRSCSAAGPPG